MHSNLGSFYDYCFNFITHIFIRTRLCPYTNTDIAAHLQTTRQLDSGVRFFQFARGAAPVDISGLMKFYSLILCGR